MCDFSLGIYIYSLGSCNRTLFLHVSIHGVAVAQGAKAGSAWRWSAALACLHVAEARLLDSCLAQPYEAGLAEPTIGLLASGPIGWRSKITITALAGKLFDKLFA